MSVAASGALRRAHHCPPPPPPPPPPLTWTRLPRPRPRRSRAAMEDAGASLMGTLLLMFVGALLCGAAPFFLRIRESHLQTLAALGAGLLIGSALAVIIPEGFHAFAEVRLGGGERCRLQPC